MRGNLVIVSALYCLLFNIILCGINYLTFERFSFKRELIMSIFASILFFVVINFLKRKNEQRSR